MTVAAATERSLDEVATERLEAEISEFAGRLAAAECRWLELLYEYDRRRAYEAWGCISCAYWLSWKCGLDLRSARDKVRVARALMELPLVRAAFAAGRLSYSKVRAITRVATRATEADLVMLAEHGTAQHVERIVRAFRRCIDVEQERRGVRDRHARTDVWSFWDDDGSGLVYARLAPEDAATVRKALDAAREDLRSGLDGSAEPPGRGPLAAQALVAMAESYLANGPAARDERYQVMVHADHDVLTADTDGRCELDDGPSLSPDTARRLACDQPIVGVLVDSLRRPVGVGTKVKDPPERLKRAVRARDRGCRFAGCGHRHFTQIHHVRWRSRKGEHTMENLVELCWHHHWLVHEGGWDLAIEPDGSLTVFKPDGSTLDPRPVVPTNVDPTAMAPEVPVEPATIGAIWYGDPLDLDHVTTSLMQQWVWEHPEAP